MLHTSLLHLPNAACRQLWGLDSAAIGPGSFSGFSVVSLGRRAAAAAATAGAGAVEMTRGQQHQQHQQQQQQ